MHKDAVGRNSQAESKGVIAETGDFEPLKGNRYRDTGI